MPIPPPFLLNRAFELISQLFKLHRFLNSFISNVCKIFRILHPSINCHQKDEETPDHHQRYSQEAEHISFNRIKGPEGPSGHQSENPGRCERNGPQTQLPTQQDCPEPAAEPKQDHRGDHTRDHTPLFLFGNQRY